MPSTMPATTATAMLSLVFGELWEVGVLAFCTTDSFTMDFLPEAYSSEETTLERDCDTSFASCADCSGLVASTETLSM